jgi:hypothetical protein
MSKSKSPKESKMTSKIGTPIKPIVAKSKDISPNDKTMTSTAAPEKV